MVIEVKQGHIKVKIIHVIKYNIKIPKYKYNLEANNGYINKCIISDIFIRHLQQTLQMIPNCIPCNMVSYTLWD